MASEHPIPVSGEHHKRAVKVMAYADSPDPGGHVPLDVYDRLVRIYLTSLAEQGVRLVDLREVVEWLRAEAEEYARRSARLSPSCSSMVVARDKAEALTFAADQLERRFGGHEGSG